MAIRTRSVPWRRRAATTKKDHQQNFTKDIQIRLHYVIFYIFSVFSNHLEVSVHHTGHRWRSFPAEADACLVFYFICSYFSYINYFIKYPLKIYSIICVHSMWIAMCVVPSPPTVCMLCAWPDAPPCVCMAIAVCVCVCHAQPPLHAQRAAASAAAVVCVCVCLPRLGGGEAADIRLRNTACQGRLCVCERERQDDNRGN